MQTYAQAGATSPNTAYAAPGLINSKIQPKKTGKIKKTGSFKGKSNKLGHGGRAAQLKAQGVPQGVIGMLARKAGAAPGQANYHGSKGKRGR